MKQILVPLVRADSARQIILHPTRQQLVSLGQMLDGRAPGTNGNDHHPARDYDTERQRQLRAAREAGLEIRDRRG
jgi:hypothetical protein